MKRANAATVAFYDTKAHEYSESTISLDLQEIYKPFLQTLTPGAHILDAGCGSGRDTKFFLKNGYRVTSIDASPEMATLATQSAGQRCEALSFQEMPYKGEFDGIWACASLLHVPKGEMRDVLNRFARALKPSGVFYVSLKEGEGETLTDDGRFFRFYTADSFRGLVAKCPALQEISFWKTAEMRSLRHPEPWLNFLMAKK
jgi:SAM-dependent methyltransferase